MSTFGKNDYPIGAYTLQAEGREYDYYGDRKDGYGDTYDYYGGQGTDGYGDWGREDDRRWSRHPNAYEPNLETFEPKDSGQDLQHHTDYADKELWKALSKSTTDMQTCVDKVAFGEPYATETGLTGPVDGESQHRRAVSTNIRI